MKYRIEKRIVEVKDLSDVRPLASVDLYEDIPEAITDWMDSEAEALDSAKNVDMRTIVESFSYVVTVYRLTEYCIASAEVDDDGEVSDLMTMGYDIVPGSWDLVRCGDLVYGVSGWSFNTLAHYRKTAGLTQAELAEKSGVNKIQISRIERGDINLENISAINAHRLAEALGIEVSDFFD